MGESEINGGNEKEKAGGVDYDRVRTFRLGLTGLGVWVSWSRVSWIRVTWIRGLVRVGQMVTVKTVTCLVPTVRRFGSGVLPSYPTLGLSFGPRVPPGRCCSPILSLPPLLVISFFEQSCAR